MKHLFLSLLLVAPFTIMACDSDSKDDKGPGNNGDKQDTPSPSEDEDTSDGQGGQDPGDGNSGNGQTTQYSVKYARSLVGDGACTSDFRDDIAPSSELREVIVTSPVYDASPSSRPDSKYGFYVQDQDGGAFSGILVTVDNNIPQVGPGDIVDVKGHLMEAFCNAQIENAQVEIKGQGEVTPLVQEASALSKRAFQGMLVKVEHATITYADPVSQKGRKIADSELGLFFLFDGFVQLDYNSTYSITGIVRSARFNGQEEFQLVPLGPDAAVLESATLAEISDIQGSDASKACTADNSAACPQGGEVSCIANFGDYTVEAVVQSPAIVVNEHQDETKTLYGHFVGTEDSQEPYSGILVIGNKDLILNAELEVGDKVRVTGTHNEYYCHTQFRAKSIDKIAEGSANEAIHLDGESDFEAYEGMLVSFSNLTVTGKDDHGALTTDAGILLVGSLDNAALQEVPASTVLESVEGYIFYDFRTYRLLPTEPLNY